MKPDVKALQESVLFYQKNRDKEEKAFKIAQVMHGEMARRIRDRQGESLRGLARKMDLSAGFLCDLEKGRKNWTPKIISAWKRAMSV